MSKRTSTENAMPRHRDTYIFCMMCVWHSMFLFYANMPEYRLNVASTAVIQSGNEQDTTSCCSESIVDKSRRVHWPYSRELATATGLKTSSPCINHECLTEPFEITPCSLFESLIASRNIVFHCITVYVTPPLCLTYK